MTEDKKIYKTNGVISKLETTFAYVRSDIGSIFVPLNVAIPQTEVVHTFADVYRTGDEVFIKALKQTSTANGKHCPFRAIKMRKKPVANVDFVGSNNDGSQIEGSSSNKLINVRVTSVTDTFAYAHVPEVGAIFVPGGAFRQCETTRLSSHLKIDDRLLVTIERQKEMNGCKWKATSATKFCESTEDFAGYGKITSVFDLHCTVQAEEIDIEIHCSLLSYTGGDRGRNATFLTDVVEVGEYVIFKVEERESEFRATCWYPINSKQIDLMNLMRTEEREVCDSSCQTNSSVEEFLIRTICQNHPEVMQKYMTSISLIDKKLLE